ncbi:hypothetical protein V2J09_017900 [Rumex salicifolius]
MGGGGGGGGGAERELDQTPTWAVASICAIIILISIVLEKALHLIGEYFEEKKKKALYEALEKVKGELMVLGFISLLLTFGQNYIANICIHHKLADTMLPCPKRSKKPKPSHGHEPTKQVEHGIAQESNLVSHAQRMLSAGGKPAECAEGKVPLISADALHQLHIFIFFLAVFHVVFSALVMIMGRLKIRRWKEWELEAMQNEEAAHHSSTFRLTHETSFVRDNSSFWTRTPILFMIVCFFRQFFRSVRRSDYLAMRHAFITVHLAPGSRFDFQKYIKRSLEDDFKVVVGISPLLWASAVFFLLVDVNTWDSMSWLSIVPPVLILAVGTKLQAIIAEMAVEIIDKHAITQGMPVIEVSDRHFWFSWPQLVLFLIHYVLFQNAFEITYFFWISYEFGLKSCFHRNLKLTIVRVALGFVVQFMCSYITLPLYALVTQMGSNMKKSIFDEQTSKALKKWHKNVRKKLGSNHNEGSSHSGEGSSRIASDSSHHPSVRGTSTGL